MKGPGRLARSRARLRSVFDPPGWRWMLAALGCGGLAALGQAPLGWWLATLAGVAAVVALTSGGLPGQGWPQPRAGAGRSFCLGWAAGSGYFAVALFWIVEPFMVDPVRHGWMAPFGLFFMAAGMALFWGAAGAAAAVLAPDRPGRRALAMIAALGMAELARGHLLGGFPWALVGHVWIDTPLAQLAAIIGASGLTALTITAAGAPAAGALAAAQGRRIMSALLATAVAVAVLVGGWQWGAARLSDPGVTASAEPAPLRLRMVQPNAPQHLKWRADLAWFWFERQLDLTAAVPAAGEPAPDLVIWPETAIPWLLEDAWYALTMIAEAAGGASVAIGVQRREAGRHFNSLAVIEPDAEIAALYDKHHLVPFGEYVPLSGLIADTPLAGLAGRALAGFSPGPGPELMDLGAAGMVAPMICYETVFPRHLRAVERPDWILQVTNDAWFGSISGPYQHLAQARFRAVEFGLPVVRVANTGVSAVIDGRGRVVAAMPLNVAGWLDADLPDALPPTPFARAGEAPLAALLSLILMLLAGLRLRRRD